MGGWALWFLTKHFTTETFNGLFSWDTKCCCITLSTLINNICVYAYSYVHKCICTYLRYSGVKFGCFSSNTVFKLLYMHRQDSMSCIRYVLYPFCHNNLKSHLYWTGEERFFALATFRYCSIVSSKVMVLACTVSSELHKPSPCKHKLN